MNGFTLTANFTEFKATEVNGLSSRVISVTAFSALVHFLACCKLTPYISTGFMKTKALRIPKSPVAILANDPSRVGFTAIGVAALQAQPMTAVWLKKIKIK